MFLGTWKKKFDWFVRKPKYRAALEASLSCLNLVIASPEEKAAVIAVIEALKNEQFKVFRFFEIETELNLLWRPSMPAAMSREIPPHAECFPGSPRGFKAVEDWMIAMPREFRKRIQDIDRKLQGRILEAICEICQAPITERGDTVKPLNRNMRGLWRYRVGDYRLIYQPVPERNEVILVDFDARGSVYG